MSKLTVQEVAAGIHNAMFATKDTINEAYVDAIKSAGKNNGAIVAIQVLLNTVSKEIKKAHQVEKEVFDEMLAVIVDTLDVDGDVNSMDFNRMRLAADAGEAMKATINPSAVPG